MNARWQTRRVGKDPELQKLHRLGLGCVLFGRLGTGAQGHHLDGAGLQDAVVAEAVGVAEGAFPDIGNPFDVGMRVHRPDSTGSQLIMVEHAQRSHTHLLRIAIAIEGEVPAGYKPTAVFAVDLAVASDLQHYGRFQPNWSTWTI